MALPSLHFIPARMFRRELTRQERVVIRNSGIDEMAELREELASGGIDPKDAYDRSLVEAIPGITPDRIIQLIGDL